MKIEGKLIITGFDPKMGILEANIDLPTLRSNRRIQLNVPDPKAFEAEGTIVIEIPEKKNRDAG